MKFYHRAPPKLDDRNQYNKEEKLKPKATKPWIYLSFTQTRSAIPQSPDKTIFYPKPREHIGSTGHRSLNDDWSSQSHAAWLPAPAQAQWHDY